MVPITTKTLKTTFQGSRKEITRAYQLVTLLIDQLHKIHNNAHVKFYIYIKCIKKAKIKGNTLESILNCPLQKNISAVRFLFHFLIVLLNN